MPIDFFKEQQNFFTRALLILLAVTFVVGFGYVGGISIGGRGPSGGTAVEINGEKVPLAQFYNLRDALYRQYQQQIPNLPDDAIDFVTARTLDNIVELKLLSQKARELGLRISDEELAESIVNNPAFQIDGQFVGAERYADFITNRLNQSVGEFEKGYKDELLARKLVALINESAKVTDEELLNLYKTQNEEVNLNYVSFSPQDYLASIFPTDEEIQKYYDNNKADFLSEEERKAKYLRVTTSDFEKNVQVSDEELKAYYNSYKDEFKIGDELRTFEVVKDEIKSKLKDAKTTAYYNEFLYNLESGKKIKSIEKFSAENSLGEVKQSFYFKSGEASTDIPFEVKSKAFTSDAGEVTYLQMTDAIWLFEVVDIKDRQQLELASIREDIVGILKNNNARDKARIVADETLNKFISSNQSFKENAESQNLVVNETGFFNR
ncbi:MAG: hypothetical protein GTO02_11185, partial [Candidatus Dadabacteria bacterium]|nr:hypothetical protein [Candidatus Dadabacteria bacterium]NIQ14924.1 hypothetical protein [Candidatus Dadabacteria bacterium]